MKTRFSQILLNSPPLFILLFPSPASFLALMAWKLCAFPSTHNGAAPASTGGASRTAAAPEGVGGGVYVEWSDHHALAARQAATISACTGQVASYVE
jgi:hypothetical protein